MSAFALGACSGGSDGDAAGAPHATATTATAAAPDARTPSERGSAPGCDRADTVPGSTQPAVTPDPVAAGLVRISGRVVDGACHDDPVAEVGVWVYVPGTETVVGGTRTDAQGGFTVDVPPGRYDLGFQDTAQRGFVFVWYGDSPDQPGATTVNAAIDHRLDDVRMYRTEHQPVPPLQGRDDGRAIVVIGDSLVQQSTTVIRGRLETLGRVSVRGVSGERIDEMEPVARRFAALRPDVAVIALGNNDVLQGRTTEEALASLRTMLDLFDTRTCVAVTNVTTYTLEAGFNARASAFNAALAEFVRARPQVRLVDWNTTIGLLLLANPDRSAWFSDGLHFRRPTMDHFANTLAQAASTC